MKSLFTQLMDEATSLTRSGRLSEATQAIQRALSGRTRRSAPGTPSVAAAAEWAHTTRALRRDDRAAADPAAQVLEGCVFDAPARPAGIEADAPATDGDTGDIGGFICGSHSHAGLTRAYKLYVPPGAARRSLPLVVMLHGCTQDPDDFAAGTGMNERAREIGFYALYPAQSADANAGRCWNWFKHKHQQRGGGEPALIAELTRTLCDGHGIDTRRVYIAGLSAGGAMAAIVAAAYPELYAAVGVHSGLARGSAGNVGEALQAMRSGASRPRDRAAGAGAAMPGRCPVPTIVFHGDRDSTVHPRNGELVLADAVAIALADVPADAVADLSADARANAHAAEQAAVGSVTASCAAAPPTVQVEQGIGAHGRRYTRTRHPPAPGKAAAEHWLVHGAGHAWSGGNPRGSFTDSHGPDATREMLRFFFEQAARA